MHGSELSVAHAGTDKSVCTAWTPTEAQRLPEFGVFGFGLFEDRDIGIGVFPESKEVLIRSAGFGGVTGKGVSAGEAEMRQGARPAIGDESAVIENLLELGSRGVSLFCTEIRFAA